MHPAIETLLVRARQRAPRPVARMLKMVKAATYPARSSPALPISLLQDCRVCASRSDLLDHLPNGGRIAEIGTQAGHFAAEILKRSRPAELHLVDLDFSTLRADVAADPRVILHPGRSSDGLARFADGAFDWIYIDADHSYTGVRGDAARARTKLRAGGFMVFNDFAHADPFLGMYGVHRAVTEFAVEHGWPFRWLAYESNALYDVALQNPGR